MIRAVVNADDFGISAEVNKAIAECFKKRAISNTTLMVNMDYADSAVLLARENGFEDRVGIHFNLTAGEPLTNNIKKSKLLCDKEGKFNAAFHVKTATRLRLPSEERKYIYEEAEAQIRRYLEYALPEKHLDSHHHVHTDMSVWNLLIPLLKKYNFRTVRLGRNMYTSASLFNKIYKLKLNSSIKNNGFDCSKYFGSYADLEAYYDKIPSDSTIEVMLHPMYTDNGELVDTNTSMDRIINYFDDKKILVEAISI